MLKRGCEYVGKLTELLQITSLFTALCVALVFNGASSYAGDIEPVYKDATFYLHRVLSKNEFVPTLQSRQAISNSRFVVPIRVRDEPWDDSQYEEKAKFYLRMIRDRNYNFVQPVEVASVIEESKVYTDLKDHCKAHSIKIWSPRDAQIVGEISVSDAIKSGYVPYAPGHPRPLDYETILHKGQMHKANGLFALYQLPNNEHLYVLSAGQFNFGEEWVSKKIDQLVNSFTVFDGKNCTFHGSIDYNTYFVFLKDRVIIRGLVFDAIREWHGVSNAFVGELVEIDGVYCIVILTVTGINYPRNLQYFLSIWELSFEEGADGNLYNLTSSSR